MKTEEVIKEVQTALAAIRKIDAGIKSKEGITDAQWVDLRCRIAPVKIEAGMLDDTARTAYKIQKHSQKTERLKTKSQ